MRRSWQRRRPRKRLPYLMLECEFSNADGSCPSNAAVTLDCDECKNTWVCMSHVAISLTNHFTVCQRTVHVDPLVSPKGNLRDCHD